MATHAWKQRVLFICLCSLTLLCACSNGVPDGFALYEDESNGFAIAYPQDWEEMHGMGTLVSFAEPGESAKGRPNFGVTSEKLNSTMTPEQYLQQARIVMKQVMPKFEFLGQQNETIDGRDAIRFQYSIVIDGQQLTLVGFATIQDNMAYVVTGGCQNEQFADYEGIFDQAGRSLRLI